MQESKEIVARILAGDPNAFKKLVRRNQRLVGQIVFRMIPNEVDREDVCQDIFIRVYENLEGFQFQAKLSTWIARITYNTCLNYLEKKKVPLYEDISAEGATLDDCCGQATSPYEWTRSRQASVQLAKEIDQLPVIYGTIISLYHLQNMKYCEIGNILSLPEGTVKSYLFRARKMLKERMLVKYNREELCA